MDKHRSKPVAARPRVTFAAKFVVKWREVGWPALASALMLWAAQPPLGLSLLAWIAPIGLLWLVEREQAPKKLGYFCLWLAGCAYWLAILQGIRLAYWPLIFGWLALSLYLAIYFPLFVGVSRLLTKRYRMPLMIAAPIAWTGLELGRSYLLTGYAASGLAHSQYRWPVVIQLADQVGSYGVSFVMMSVAVLAYRGLIWARTQARPMVWEPIVAITLVSLLLGYGSWRLSESQRMAEEAHPLLRVALIQENTPSMFDANPQRLVVAWDSYAEQTVKALEQAGHSKGHPVDVIVWPESTFTGYSTKWQCGITWMEDKIVETVPEDLKHLDRLTVADMVGTLQREFRSKVAVLHTAIAQKDAQPTSPPYLFVGNDAVEFTDAKIEQYNAVLLIDPEGHLVNRYEKIHLVMFGEYVPLGPLLKPLADMFGLKCSHGRSPKAFEVNGVELAPSICFESMMPQVMSWLLRSLKSQGHDPQVLVNVTNDSWFRGSSMLDHHLACEVMTAVELRRPFLIAANTGLTAWIDGSGRIVQQSKRLEPAFIIAEPLADSRFGMTQVWGDLPAWCLGLFVVGAMVHGVWTRKSQPAAVARGGT